MNIRLAVLACVTASCGQVNALPPAAAETPVGGETEVVIASHGWRLVGDLYLPDDNNPVPGVLMLIHRRWSASECVRLSPVA